MDTTYTNTREKGNTFERIVFPQSSPSGPKALPQEAPLASSFINTGLSQSVLLFDINQWLPNGYPPGTLALQGIPGFLFCLFAEMATQLATQRDFFSFLSVAQQWIA